jgi:hypothetical protein
LPLADHPHDLEAFDCSRRRGQRLESSRWIDQPLERAVISRVDFAPDLCTEKALMDQGLFS